MNSSTNATVLGVAPLHRTLPVAGAILVLLFVLMKPESTSGFSFGERLLFWTAHIGLGLASIVIASRLLRPPLMAAVPLPLAVFLTGLAGAALLAPVYLGLEQLIPARLRDAPDDWLDIFAGRGPLHAVLAEFLEIAPVFLAAWAAINLPLLFPRSEISGTTPPGPDGPTGPGRDATPEESREPPRNEFYARLPLAIGRDIVAISSDMHYLHVHTSLGKCMILGSLREAAAMLGDAGMLTHRSHWVAHAHVERLVRRDGNWECLASGGLRIPVSRRNRSRVLEWHGSQARVARLDTRAGRKSASGG
jgi:hypothetical protein